MGPVGLFDPLISERGRKKFFLKDPVIGKNKIQRRQGRVKKGKTNHKLNW